MSFSRELWDWTRSIIIAVALALVLRFFVVEHFKVDGSSMVPTLRDGERLIVNKFVYNFNDPGYGDIVVFKYSSNRDFIKRVVGTTGDVLHCKDNRLYRNNQPVEEPYLKDGYLMRDFGPVEVPEGHIFVMGDNRTESKDSRDDDVGFISLEQVRGKAFFVFWPITEAGAL